VPKFDLVHFGVKTVVACAEAAGIWIMLKIDVDKSAAKSKTVMHLTGLLDLICRLVA
jgi:hypothetical protein